MKKLINVSYDALSDELYDRIIDVIDEFNRNFFINDMKQSKSQFNKKVDEIEQEIDTFVKNVMKIYEK